MTYSKVSRLWIIISLRRVMFAGMLSKLFVSQNKKKPSQLLKTATRQYTSFSWHYRIDLCRIIELSPSCIAAHQAVLTLAEGTVFNVIHTYRVCCWFESHLDFACISSTHVSAALHNNKCGQYNVHRLPQGKCRRTKGHWKWELDFHINEEYKF